MKTLYAACLSRLGLSQAGAASLHGVRLDTVKSWSSGRNTVPQGAWDDLRLLELELVDASEAMREDWPQGAPLIVDDGHAGHKPLMAAADFVLNCDVGTQISVRRPQ
jgi:hypothetical protein